MLRTILLAVTSLLVLLAPSAVRAQSVEQLKVVLSLQDDDTLVVEESYRLSGKLERPFERTILREVAPGPAPRRQWISDLKVDGKGVRYSSHHALDRTRVRIRGATGSFVLRYRIHRLVGSDGRFSFSILDTGKLPIRQLSTRFVPPRGLTAKDLSSELTVMGDTEGAERFFKTVDNGPLEQSFAVGASDVSVAYDIKVPPASVKTPPFGAQLAETVEQAGLLPYLGALFFLLALVLRFLPIGLVIGVTRLWHLVAAVPVVLLTAPDVIYFLVNGPLDEGLAGLGIGLGYVALVGGYLWLQDRGLCQSRREAFHIELALPVVLTLAFPTWNNPAAALFLPLLGLPVIIYWFRQDIALAFGAASHRIVEHVVTEGSTTLDALARQFSVGRERLERVLKQQPDLPLVVDYAKGTVYSEQAAAQLAEIAVCSNCGGATEIGGMDVVACPYCRREYAKAASQARERPVPVIVEAFARILFVLAAILAFWGVAFALAFAGFEGGFGAVVLLPLVLFGGLALGAGLLGSRLREGGGYGWLVALLILSAPFVMPLFAFLPLGRRRVKLHFGRADTSGLSGELEKKGEMSLKELAARWETSLAEATELARFLCVSGGLDAVYDRPRSRIVHRSHYATLEHQGACDHCGGTLGVSAGVVRCHYCRTPAAA